MVAIENLAPLLLAPLAGAAAWRLATRGRRGRRLSGFGAALSVSMVAAALAGIFTGERAPLRVFVLDVSASTRGAGRELLPLVRSAAARMKPFERAAVVAFGRDASVVLPPTPVSQLPFELPPPAGVDQDGTSISRGLESALALHGRKRAGGDILLVTDGRETAGDSVALGARLAEAALPVHSLTLSTAPEQDAWVEEIRAPSSVAADQPIDFEVLIGSSRPMHGKLVLLLDGREMAGPEPVDVISRRTVIARRTAPARPGLHIITARLLCPGDVVSENNESSAAVRVRGKVEMTLVTEKEAGSLAAAFSRSESIALTRVSPRALVPGNEALLRVDVMVLDDVSAGSLGTDGMEWLRRSVTDGGLGLVVFGGKDSFGPGGYARTPLDDLLPVDSDPERRAAKPSSVAVVADRSGSMAERVGGRQKIEFVKEALLRAGAEFAARTAERSDELSVVAFNQEPEVLLERESVTTPEGGAALRSAAGRIFPSGRTNIPLALRAARSVLARSALRRHIILVSDGRSQEPIDPAGLAASLKAEGVVLTVLAPDEEKNEGLSALKEVAQATEGRFVMLKDISELPAAMARETRTIGGTLVREGRFEITRGPGVWFGGIAVPPPVGGYVLTGARSEAPPQLVTGDAPVLATWRRGLGRVAACTTSLDAWAPEWPASSAGMGLIERLALWAASAARESKADVRVEVHETRLRILADAKEPLEDAQPEAVLFAPAGKVEKIVLKRVGRLAYEGSAESGETGTYAAKVVDARTGELLGQGHTTLGYSAEWKPGGDGLAARRLSLLTGGKILKDLEDLPPLAAAEAGARAGHNLAYVLLGLAAAVFFVSTLR